MQSARELRLIAACIASSFWPRGGNLRPALHSESPAHEAPEVGRPMWRRPGSKEHEMIEFVLTARGVFLRLQIVPETLALILILARLWPRLL